MIKLRNGKILMNDVPWLVVQKLMEIFLHINASIGEMIKWPLTKFKLDVPHTSYAQNLLFRFAKKVLKDFFNGKITKQIAKITRKIAKILHGPWFRFDIGSSTTFDIHIPHH